MTTNADTLATIAAAKRNLTIFNKIDGGKSLLSASGRDRLAAISATTLRTPDNLDILNALGDPDLTPLTVGRR